MQPRCDRLRIDANELGRQNLERAAVIAVLMLSVTFRSAFDATFAFFPFGDETPF
jgi:hypothetical protein